MSLKRICATVVLATLFASCTHVGTKVGNLSKGGFTTIVVDAGHGGKDNGGTSGRGSNPFQREKDLTLDTAKRLRELLRRSGFRVVMMREGDYFIELDERVARANKEGMLVISHNVSQRHHCRNFGDHGFRKTNDRQGAGHDHDNRNWIRNVYVSDIFDHSVRAIFGVATLTPSIESLNSPSVGLPGTNRRNPATPSTLQLVRRAP